MNTILWAQDIVGRGAKDKNRKPPMKMDNYELASSILYHKDQIRNGELNIKILDYFPEQRTESFNQTSILYTIQYHIDELEAYNAEVIRRHIP